MDSEFEGKVVVITGSSTGIGRATAQAFRDRGARLILVDYVDDPTGGLGAASNILTFRADLRDTEAAKQCVAAIAAAAPVVDVLFNNAGALVVESVANTDIDLWNATNNLNVTAPYLFIRGLLEAMKRSGSASIINHASIDGLFGHPMMPVYGSAKGALISVTRNFSFELGKFNIRINSIATGGIDTPLLNGLDDAGRRQLAAMTPLQRLGTADEVASVVMFLASRHAGYVSGSVITVDGGRTANTSGIVNMDPHAKIRN